MSSLFTPEQLGEPPRPKIPPAKPCRAPDAFWVGLRDVFREHGATMGLDDGVPFVTSEDGTVWIFDFHGMCDKVNG